VAICRLALVQVLAKSRHVHELKLSDHADASPAFTLHCHTSRTKTDREADSAAVHVGQKLGVIADVEVGSEYEACRVVAGETESVGVGTGQHGRSLPVAVYELYLDLAELGVADTGRVCGRQNSLWHELTVECGGHWHAQSRRRTTKHGHEAARPHTSSELLVIPERRQAATLTASIEKELDTRRSVSGLRS
jgi:hypothetical protein